MSEDIWSKERPLNLEKIASSKVRKALMKLAAAWANDPNYNSGKKDPDASTKVTTTADDTKNARTAEVVPRIPPATMSTDTVASSTPGSKMPGTGGQQQKIAGLGLDKEYPAITKSSETRNIAEDSSHIPWWKKVKRHNDLIQE
jgi:hypothetical protein